MNNQDYWVRASTEGVWAVVARTTNLVDMATKRHDCYPVATAALGRVMTGALLLSSSLKNNETLTLKIEGDGKLGKIIADAAPSGQVRGYVEHAQVQLPAKNGKLDVGAGVGSGNLSLMRFTGLKTAFTGRSKLISGEIAEDIAHYLYTSEQIPATISLGVLVNQDFSVQSAGGLLIQAFPGADPELLEQIEHNLSLLPPVSYCITNGDTPHAILENVFQNISYKISSEQELSFSCHCSKDYIARVLYSLDKADLQDLLLQEETEVVCHFCNEKYHFTSQEIENLLKN